MAQEEAKFRFVDLEIWQDSIEVAERLFDLADGLEAKSFTALLVWCVALFHGR